jgi:hypothetical protein
MNAMQDQHNAVEFLLGRLHDSLVTAVERCIMLKLLKMPEPQHSLGKFLDRIRACIVVIETFHNGLHWAELRELWEDFDQFAGRLLALFDPDCKDAISRQEVERLLWDVPQIMVRVEQFADYAGYRLRTFHDPAALPLTHLPQWRASLCLS